MGSDFWDLAGWKGLSLPHVLFQTFLKRRRFYVTKPRRWNMDFYSQKRRSCSPLPFPKILFPWFPKQNRRVTPISRTSENPPHAPVTFWWSHGLQVKLIFFSDEHKNEVPTERFGTVPVTVRLIFLSSLFDT